MRLSHPAQSPTGPWCRRLARRATRSTGRACLYNGGFFAISLILRSAFWVSGESLRSRASRRSFFVIIAESATVRDLDVVLVDGEAAGFLLGVGGSASRGLPCRNLSSSAFVHVHEPTPPRRPAGKTFPSR